MTARQHSTRARGLATRILTSQLIVLIAGALTTAVVAIVVGPPIFHTHLLEAGHRAPSPELTHIEMAYQDASWVSLGLGLVIALLAATTVTWFLSRRLRRPLGELTQAARELSRGHYANRVPDVGFGTELDTLAAAFNAMAARLEQVEATRRRLLTDLAHELRTPIATLTAYHDGLHDGLVDLGPESRSVLSEQTERLVRLVEDIDEVSSAEEGRLGLHPAWTPVTEILSAAAYALRDRFEARGVQLRISPIDDTDTRVFVDRRRVGQVLTNLLTNALRHTPATGTVTVSAEPWGEEVLLEVTDNGEGIAAEHLPHLFERFYRADASRSRDGSGSGIGLTISKAIVDAHGGSLTVHSAGLGHGATFTISLPASGPRH